jgi:hypothetical protein
MPPVVHEVSDLNAPGPKVSLGREIGCEGDREQSAGVGRKDASADVEAVAPSTGFAGNGIAAVVGRTASFHQNIYLLHAKPFTAMNIKEDIDGDVLLILAMLTLFWYYSIIHYGPKGFL